MIVCLNKRGFYYLINLLNIWCFNYKNAISLNNLEKRCKWKDYQDTTLLDKYSTENSIVLKYFKEVPFYKWIDAFLKSDTGEYEPEALVYYMPAISDEFKNFINEKNLEDKSNSLAFYDVWQLGKKGGYGSTRLVKTNPIFFGIEVKIAIKTILKPIENDDERIKKENEFDLLNNINHPNIMKAYKKWKTSENQLEFAFEYLPWKDLYEI